MPEMAFVSLPTCWLRIWRIVPGLHSWWVAGMDLFICSCNKYLLNFPGSTWTGVLFWPSDLFIRSLTAFLAYQVPVLLNPLWVPASHQMNISQGRVLSSICLSASPWRRPIYYLWHLQSVQPELSLILVPPPPWGIVISLPLPKMVLDPDHSKVPPYFLWLLVLRFQHTSLPMPSWWWVTANIKCDTHAYKGTLHTLQIMKC